ncbi:protransforming growth factor alpha [Solea senegalensis]|uniref:Protransforming growth factor alpha n=1 Tax=Solea senegalensis TaxID=28829 RepID=A0AAV6QNI4_SOLSE|nr:protransforming growth factor alpha [Solea senegalensis]
MTRIFWDAILLISGSLFTFGAGPSNSTIQTSISFNTNSIVAPNTPISNSAASVGATLATATDVHPVKNSLFTFGEGRTDSSLITSGVPIHANDSSSSSSTSGSTTTTTVATTTTSTPPVKKFVAAAVRSHFDDCPDSHRHFCFHGTCRFLILEETPACVCHPGFIGMRCEHADLLAVVATNHRQQTVATVLVLCVIGCVLVMVLCTLLQ